MECEAIIATWITAGLQLFAVILFIFAYREARKTTRAAESTLSTAKKQLDENRSASEGTIKSLGDLLKAQEEQLVLIKETTDELVDLRQTTILGHLLLQWDNESIQFSASHSEWLLWDGKPISPTKAYHDFNNNNVFDRNKSMAIPRFFDMLEELICKGVIEEAVAIGVFHEKASYYWYRFENQIIGIRKSVKESGKYGHYQFIGFERFAKHRIRKDIVDD